MAEKLFDTQSSGNSDWSADIAFELDARVVCITNTGAYPVKVRFGIDAATSGNATAKVAAGTSKTWVFQTSQRKDRVALFGVGGVSTCDIEVSEDKLEVNLAGASGNLVLADLSSSTPAVPTASGSAGTAATAARGDHAHPNNLSSSTPASPTAGGTAGVATTGARSDHAHPNNLSSDTPAALAASASAGVATAGARSDHAHPRPTVGTQQTLVGVDLTAIAAPSATAIHGGFASNNTSATRSADGQPPHPVNLTIAFPAAWDGGDITVTGTDQYDDAVSEVFADNPGSTVTGTKVFKTINSNGIAKQTIGANGDNCTIGYGKKLGMVVGAATAQGALASSVNALYIPAAGTLVSATWDTTYDAVTPGSDPSTTTYLALVRYAHTHVLS